MRKENFQARLPQNKRAKGIVLSYDGIFNFIGGIFGYILWGAFFLVKNFGIAIMIFTIIIKLIMFPLSVKQQKSMAANARFQAKQQEILKKYANNRQKANEESALLMQKREPHLIRAV